MRAAVVGTGLIGGSVGLALRERAGAHVVGVGPEADAAVQRGACDEAAPTVADALRDAELCVVATPLGVLPKVCVEALAAAPKDCVVTDVGSAKQVVADAVHGDPRFVGGHPLAGAEAGGVAHARADLFDGAVWYLVPSPRTEGLLFERLHRTLVALGAQPAAIDADVHDRLMAVISHLPHVVANVLVAQATRALDEDGESLPATGPSFRDATRVAGANPAIWPDILLANRDAVTVALDEAIERLAAARDALLDDDHAAVEAAQHAALHERRALLEVGLEGGVRTELRVAVPNRPGVVAELALALGRAGVNISDMTLSPSADHRHGTVALWVDEADAARAREVVAPIGPVSEP